jgi:ribose 5-phosphate isomerase B
MTIYLASDHGGWELKKKLIDHLQINGRKINDLGPHELAPLDDYPDYAIRLAQKVAQDPHSVGILICRSGIGMSVMANKVKGIRAGLCTYSAQAHQAREHVNCNILVLDSDYSKNEEAANIVDIFLNTEPSEEERHVRRINKIKKFEEKC